MRLFSSCFQSTDTFNSPQPALTKQQLASKKDFITSRMPNVPQGIQNELIAATEEFPQRIWIVDNSGSMSTGDGHMLQHKGGREGMIKCSRWNELAQTLNGVGELAIGLRAPTQFLLLNPTGGCSKITLGCSGGSSAEEHAQLSKLTRSSPTGGTPLCARIREVVASVKAQAPKLRKRGQRAVVTIATDGMSSDGDVAAALRPLEKLPVWVVIKLCTDDDAVVDYWNQIDEDLELDMDVLDDLVGEAEEVCAVNPWLAYGPALHRLREWGSPHKLLDMLDETPFSLDQCQQMMALVLGADAVDALGAMPLFTSSDAPAYAAELGRVQARQAPVWDPLRQRRGPWFDAARLPGMQSMPSAPPVHDTAGISAATAGAGAGALRVAVERDVAHQVAALKTQDLPMAMAVAHP